MVDAGIDTATLLHEKVGSNFLFLRKIAPQSPAPFQFGAALGAGIEMALHVAPCGQGGDSVTVAGINAGERVAVKGVSGLKAMLTGVGKE